LFRLDPNHLDVLGQLLGRAIEIERLGHSAHNSDNGVLSCTAVAEEQRLAGSGGVRELVPDEEAFDLRVGGQAIGEFASHQIEPSQSQQRMIDSRQRLEHWRLEGLGALSENDQALSVVRFEIATLQVHEKQTGGEQRRDRPENRIRPLPWQARHDLLRPVVRRMCVVKQLAAHRGAGHR
jgi:hypothetical protein